MNVKKTAKGNSATREVALIQYISPVCMLADGTVSLLSLHCITEPDSSKQASKIDGNLV